MTARTLSALDDDGRPSPWWFAYKLASEVYLCAGDPATFTPSKTTLVSEQRVHSRFFGWWR